MPGVLKAAPAAPQARRQRPGSALTARPGTRRATTAGHAVWTGNYSAAAQRHVFIAPIVQLATAASKGQSLGRRI